MVPPSASHSTGDAIDHSVGTRQNGASISSRGRPGWLGFSPYRSIAIRSELARELETK